MQQLSAFVMKRKNWPVRLAVLILPLAVLVLTLSQTAFAQVTYVITDGDQVTYHTSSASDPERILHEAGVLLDEEDTFTTSGGNGGYEITVQRGQVITLCCQGQTTEVFSYGESVSSLMERLNLTGEPSLPGNTQTYDGMELSIYQVVRETQSSTVEIPYDVTILEDPYLEAGVTYVASHGVAGEALRTDSVVYTDKIESSRENLSYEVIQEPVDEIVVQGTGEKVGQKDQAPVIGDGVILLPTGEVLTYTRSDVFIATAYTSWIADVVDMTATGTQARVGAIAVDPTVVPYGTRMFIVSNDGEFVYGIATAEDCGGGVKGKHVDLFFDTLEDCYQFGARKCTIYFLGGANWRGDINWRNN